MFFQGNKGAIGNQGRKGKRGRPGPPGKPGIAQSAIKGTPAPDPVRVLVWC